MSKTKALAVFVTALIALALINGCKEGDKELNVIIIAGSEFPQMNGTFAAADGVGTIKGNFNGVFVFGDGK
jgi:hypothetical protein